MRRSTAWLVSTATLAVLGGAFLWPLAWVIGGGFLEDGRFTLRFLAGVFRNPIYVEGLVRSLWIAVGTTALVLLIALPLAWMAPTSRARWASGLWLCWRSPSSAPAPSSVVSWEPSSACRHLVTRKRSDSRPLRTDLW